MDQKLNRRTEVWVSVAGVICGIIMLPVAIGAIASFPDSIGWLGIVLVFCSILVCIYSFRNLRSSRRSYRETDTRVRALLSATEPPSITLKEGGFKQPAQSSKASDVLANWEYNNEEWQNFLRWERRDRKFGSVANFLVVLVISFVLIQIKSDAGWFISLLLSFPIAALYTWIIMIFRRSSFGKANSRDKIRVILTGEAVVINKTLNEFVSKKKSLKEVRIIEEAEPKVLEIEYEWLTNGGLASDRIHIPIPKGKLGEAVLLMDKLSVIGVSLV